MLQVSFATPCVMAQVLNGVRLRGNWAALRGNVCVAHLPNPEFQLGKRKSCPESANWSNVTVYRTRIVLLLVLCLARWFFKSTVTVVTLPSHFCVCQVSIYQRFIILAFLSQGTPGPAEGTKSFGWMSQRTRARSGTLRNWTTARTRRTSAGRGLCGPS